MQQKCMHWTRDYPHVSINETTNDIHVSLFFNSETNVQHSTNTIW